MKLIWTEDMKKTLRELASCKNFSYGDIAKIMTTEYGEGFTKNSVIGMAARIGIPRRPSIIKPAVNRITIERLEWGMCKWPLGSLSDRPPFIYCGKDTGPSCSWCPEHCKKAFSKPTYDSAKIVRSSW